MIGLPVVLSSSLGLTPSDPSALICPANRAMLVEEICLAATSSQNVALHEWELALGRAIITQGSVPVALCARAEDCDRGGTLGEFYSWRLPRPMYVPAGKTLTVRFRPGQAAARAQLALRARVLPIDYAAPAKIDVPYATAFKSGVGTLDADESAESFVYRSGPGDLSNLGPVPLHVQRLAGWASGAGGSGDTVERDDQSGGTRRLARVQISDASGFPVVRDATRLLDLCGAAHTSWEVDFDLPPRSSLYATLDMTHPAYEGSDGAQVQAMLGLVGWREVDIGEVL